MPPDDTAHRRNLLTTALVGALPPKDVLEGHMVRAWLDSWAGLGHVAETMHDIGYDVRLSRSVFEWSADFCRSDLSPLAYRFKTSRDAKLWRAVQRAALETLRKEQAQP
jgi:hypothetical protein